QFAREVLMACQRGNPSLFDRLRYVIIERSPAMQESQQRLLAPWLHQPAHVSWVNSVTELGSGGVVGALFSNELVDAFPVHRLRVKNARPYQIYVSHDGRGFL